MGTLCRFPERGHIIRSEVREQRRFLDHAQPAPHPQQLCLVEIMNWVPGAWIRLGDDDPLFDAGRRLLEASDYCHPLLPVRDEQLSDIRAERVSNGR